MYLDFSEGRPIIFERDLVCYFLSHEVGRSIVDLNTGVSGKCLYFESVVQRTQLKRMVCRRRVSERAELWVVGHPRNACSVPRKKSFILSVTMKRLFEEIRETRRGDLRKEELQWIVFSNLPS